LSQSPQTGQFNSYADRAEKVSSKSSGLNPLKRVNSILTEFGAILDKENDKVSIPSNGSIQFLQAVEEFGLFNGKGLNPLKRVNSILTSYDLGGLK